MKKYWWKFFLAVFPLMVVWSITNPMFASPDEPAHMVRAQGIVRGQLDGPYKVDGIPVEDIKCLAFKPEASSDCMTLEWAEAPTYEDSTATNYPPLFHFLAGLPSLFLQGLTGAYAMRIWMALICSSLLALTGSMLFSRYRNSFIALGWALSLTPMVLFLSATVNPSGIAVALGSLIWASGMLLIDPNSESRKPLLYRILGFSMLAFLLVRRDSLVWLLAIGVSLVAYNPKILKLRWNRFLQTLIVAFGSLGILAIVSWVVPSWSFFSAGNSGRNRWASIPNDTYTYAKQAVGWFGWLDTPLSDPLMFTALFVLGAFLVVGLAVSGERETRALVAVVAVVFLAPLLFAEFRYPYFQGRYYLPFAVGGFYLAGKSLGEIQISEYFRKRFVGLIGLTWATVHFWSVLTNIRRY